MDKLDKINIFNKELDLIQSVVDRMARNSFEIKKWTLTIVATILGLKEQLIIKSNSEASNERLLVIIIVSFVLSTWILDAFYFRREKIYRAIYEGRIRKRKNEYEKIKNYKDIDLAYNLNFNKEKSDVKVNYPCFLNVFFSKKTMGFYLLLIIVILGMYIFLKV